MPRSLGSVRALVLLAASLVLTLAVPARAGDRTTCCTAAITSLSAQLGVAALPHEGDQLEVGSTFTGMLDDPGKLAAFGIRDMHKGARVTVSRVAPDRIRVEADELEPKMVRSVVTLKLEDRGTLVVSK